MNSYTLLNLLVLALAAAVLVIARPSSFEFRLYLRAAMLMVLVAYPWDFFGIHFGAWTYSNPGPLLFGVPINDIVFIFLCNLIAAAVLGPLVTRASVPNTLPNPEGGDQTRDYGERGKTGRPKP